MCLQAMYCAQNKAKQLYCVCDKRYTDLKVHAFTLRYKMLCYGLEVGVCLGWKATDARERAHMGILAVPLPIGGDI